MATLTLFKQNTTNTQLINLWLQVAEQTVNGYLLVDAYTNNVLAEVFGTGLGYDNSGAINSGQITRFVRYDEQGEAQWQLSGLSLAGSSNYYSVHQAVNNNDFAARVDNYRAWLADTGDQFLGSLGNDVFRHDRGNDSFSGGQGVDTVDFSNSSVYISSSATINLATGRYSLPGGSATTSGTLTSIENIIGTSSNNGDMITGNAANNLIEGRGGHDIMDAGAGIDTASYKLSSYGVTVNLATGYAYDGTEQIYYSNGPSTSSIDELSNFENILGSRFNDTLTGSSVANVITGGLGNDTMDGGAGIDTVDYSDATRAITADLTRGSITGWGVDRVTNIENITASRTNDSLMGSSANNVLLAGSGNDSLNGAAGNDVLNGGAGVDIVLFSSTATLAASVNLSLTTAQNTGFGSDTLISIENVGMGAGNDTIIGSNDANQLAGSAGRDTINGGAGNDIIIGGADKDLLTGGTGNDVFKFNNVAEPAIGGNADIITDFTRGQDKIDLSLLDANLYVSGNQAFTFVTNFTAAGQLKFQNGVLSGTVASAEVTDFMINLSGVTTLTASDFIL